MNAGSAPLGNPNFSNDRLAKFLNPYWHLISADLAQSYGDNVTKLSSWRLDGLHEGLDVKSLQLIFPGFCCADVHQNEIIANKPRRT